MTVRRDFEYDMSKKYQCLLQKCAGLKSIVVDGQTVTLADLEAGYAFWERRYAALGGNRRRVMTMNLGNF